MSNTRTFRRSVAKHMTAEEIKAVRAVKMAVNKQPLRKRIKYAWLILIKKW